MAQSPECWLRNLTVPLIHRFPSTQRSVWFVSPWFLDQCKQNTHVRKQNKHPCKQNVNHRKKDMHHRKHKMHHRKHKMHHRKQNTPLRKQNIHLRKQARRRLISSPLADINIKPLRPINPSHFISYRNRSAKQFPIEGVRTEASNKQRKIQSQGDP